MDNQQIVKPVKEIFNFIATDGKDLRTMVMEINQIYSEYEVQRTQSEPLISELGRLGADVKARGVNRDTMAAVESYAGPLNPDYPLASYTERRSRTNVQVALEDIDGKRVGIIAAVLVAGAAFLYKIIKWVLGLFGKTEDEGKKVFGSASGGSAAAKGSDNIRSKVGDATVEKAVTSEEQMKTLTDAVSSHYTGLTRELLNPNGLSNDIFGMLTDLSGYAKVLGEGYTVGEEACTGYLKQAGTVSVGNIRLRLERIQEDTTIDRAFPGLKRLLTRHGIKLSNTDTVGYVEGLKELRAKLAAKQEEKQSIATDTRGLRKLSEGIVRIVGQRPGDRNMLAIPKTVVDVQTAIADKSEKMLKATEEIQRTFHESRMGDFTTLQDIIRALAEFQQVFNVCVMLAGWLLHQMRQFAETVEAALAFEFKVAAREASKANMDASDIIRGVTETEKQWLDKHMGKAK